MENQTIGEEIKFEGVIRLLKKSWILYWARIKTFLGIMIIPIIVDFLGKTLVNWLATTNLRYSLSFSFIWAATILVSLFLWFWSIPSLIFAIKEEIRIKEAYKKGLKMLIPFIWVYFLFYVITLGGFILFIIPGILFLIWFSLVTFVLVLEEKRGMNALFKSKHLISGKFWGVLRRFLGLILIIFILLLSILFLVFLFIESEAKVEQIGTAIGYLLRLFITPLFLIYGFLIYENLEKIKKEMPHQEATKKRILKYLLPAILGTLIFIVIVGFNFVDIFLGRDEPPPYDADLWLPKIEIAQEENAYYYFQKIDEKLNLPKEKIELFREMAEGKMWDEEFAEELIENNKEVFEYLEKAAECDYSIPPGWEDPKTISAASSIPSLREVRDVARLNSIRATYFFKSEKEENAFSEIFRIIKVGHLIQDSRNLLSYLLGMQIKEMGFQRLRELSSETTLSPEILKNYSEELKSFQANQEGLKNAFKMEYITAANHLEAIGAGLFGKPSKEDLEMLRALEIDIEEFPFLVRGVIKLNYLYKPNQTKRLFAEHFRSEIEKVDKNYNQIKFFEIETLVPHSRIKMLLTENIIGKQIRDMVAISLEGILLRRYEEDFSARGTQLLMAIKAYKTEKGELPFALEELVPEYISEVPEDPFNGKPIRYSAEKKIIYSVGQNLQDEGGSEGEDWRRMPDLTFKIGF